MRDVRNVIAAFCFVSVVAGGSMSPAAAAMCARECNYTCDKTTPSPERAAACKVRWACDTSTSPCTNQKLVNYKIEVYRLCKRRGLC
jgi:hypothetical protein